MKATSISKTIKRKQNRKSMSHGMVNTVDNVNVSVSDHALILELHDKLDIALQMVQDILETEKSQ